MKCSNFPGRKKGKKEIEIERIGLEGKERRRERIRDRMEWYIEKEEGIVSEETKVLNLLPGRKKFY